jgi:SAM-dependent methyltransferase
LAFGGSGPDNSEMADAGVNLWDQAEHARQYLAQADTIPHRAEGELELLACLPAEPRRVLDLGSGDGRLLALIRRRHPRVAAVAVDFSPTMLDRLRERFAGDPGTTVAAHDLAEPLPDLGTFDAIVSSFAIHHVTHERKRVLYGEIFDRLAPGGVFCNLEHVASPTAALHARFLAGLGVTPETEDPSNKLLGIEPQLAWLRDIGFADVDCHWKWRELALLAGVRTA